MNPAPQKPEHFWRPPPIPRPYGKLAKPLFIGGASLGVLLGIPIGLWIRGINDDVGAGLVLLPLIVTVLAVFIGAIVGIAVREHGSRPGLVILGLVSGCWAASVLIPWLQFI